MILIKDRRPAIVIATSCLLMLSTARAVHGSIVYVALVIDPPTTAFSGIPTVNGFAGTSTRSGSGTWHLYAIDDRPNSFGIKGVSLVFSPGAGGTIPVIQNRLPITSWDDSPNFESGGGPFSTGFNSFRGAPPLAVTGQQDNNAIAGNITVPLIDGFGATASDFKTKTGGQSFDFTTNGQWGNYADFQPIDFGSGLRYPLFVSEGTYTSAPPTINTTASLISIWSNAAMTSWLSGTVTRLSVPEPSSLLLALSGCIAYSVGLNRRRR